MTERRSSKRAPILTQVEAQGERFPLSALGRASDISVGGLLIETPDTLVEGMTAIIRFFLPPGRQAIEVAGRVVRVEPGKLMGVAFLGLPETHRQRIVNYIQEIQGTPTEKLLLEPREGWPRQRRSARIARRVAVMLNWQDDDGRQRHEAAETQDLSQYGAKVVLFSELRRGWLTRLLVPEVGREATSRVVWATPADLPGKEQLGLEVIGGENFWGLEFSSDHLPVPDAPGLARRRSPRLPRRVDVILEWTDESGRLNEGFAQTRTLSRHGAALSSLVPLPEQKRFRLLAPGMNRRAESKVVWTRPGEAPSRTHLGIEFTDTDEFWGIPFTSTPPASLF